MAETEQEWQQTWNAKDRGASGSATGASAEMKRPLRRRDSAHE